MDLGATPAELPVCCCERCVPHRRRRWHFALCLCRRRGKPASWQRDGAGGARHQPVRQGLLAQWTRLVKLRHGPAGRAASPRCTSSACCCCAGAASDGGYAGGTQPLVLGACCAGGQKARLALARAAYSRADIQVSCPANFAARSTICRGSMWPTCWARWGGLELPFCSIWSRAGAGQSPNSFRRHVTCLTWHPLTCLTAVQLLDDPLSAVDPRVGRILFDQCIGNGGLMAGEPPLPPRRQAAFLWLQAACGLMPLDLPAPKAGPAAHSGCKRAAPRLAAPLPHGLIRPF